jgi:pimeloyl-ACP methyl ester carboxylesterase
MFPVLAGDVAAAATFFRTQPGIDPARVGLAGISQAGWILPIAARQLGNVAFMVLLSGPVCSVGLEIYYSDLAEFSSALPLDDVYARLPGFNGPDGFDPIPVLRAVDTPTLWVLGEDDRSIPVRNTVENLQSLAASGKPYQWRTYPGLGHGLGPAVWADVGQWTARFR